MSESRFFPIVACHARQHCIICIIMLIYNVIAVIAHTVKKYESAMQIQLLHTYFYEAGCAFVISFCYNRSTRHHIKYIVHFMYSIYVCMYLLLNEHVGSYFHNFLY